MALDTATTTNGRLRGALGQGRGRPEMVQMRRTTAIAPLMEGIALADEVIAGATRIHSAVAVGSRALILHEAGRLGFRAQAARAEFRRLAAGIDE